ncbi:uncharacterized oxidoreductase YjmC-like isoform X2 [Hoplias malabaricus]|uniref:uncharacterized oxidoreductase YjmC-like isoform X2 n=1 Tax=Hoplias malabaricus TaxID=27720 RepID=UPI0034623B97
MSMSRCLLFPSEVQMFIEGCMCAVGTRPTHARSLADVLLEGDLRGHYSHGLNRLDLYVKETRAGICARDGDPLLEKESLATALVDGKNLLGPVVGNYCMNLAIKKAQEVGIGWVVTHGSNHFGIAAYYSIQAMKKNMICTVGTNPISLAAPAKNGDSFVLDMATSAVALGKVELHARNGMSIPEGWGCDAEGRFVTDPRAMLSGGGLVPLGGSETTGGYKGYGLGLMVEVLCGMLSGSQYSKNIRTWRMTDRKADLGQCFVAINPENFAPGFSDRMADLLSIHRNLEPAVPEMPVLAPGDPERKHIQICRELGGIPYHLSVVNHMNELASTLGVSPLLPTHRLQP